MKQSSKKSFKKFYVKRDPRTSKLMKDKNGAPITGDFIRNVRITQAQADELSLAWKQLGFIFVPDKSEEEAKELADKEAVKNDFTDIKLAWAKVEELVTAGKIEKPHHATGIDKLNLIINEVK